MEKITIQSEFKLILSESDSDTFDGKFIISDFDPNKNDVMLNRATIDEWLKTIEIKPLVGKVISKFNGVKDFTGHNVKKVKKKNADGEEYDDIEFDTSAFGSFYNSAIEEIDGKEYIVSSAKIWKRFSEACEVIKRRADTEKGIKTSWEIQVNRSHYETINGKKIKVIDDGVFIGHALLGENVEPAYDSSGMLQVAQLESVDDELAIALANDMIQHTTEEGGAKVPKTNEVSAITTRDLHQKINSALNPKGWNSNPYYSVWEVYPEDHKTLAYNIDRDSEDDYLVFTYTVSEDEVTVGTPTEVKLSNILSEKEFVASIKTKVEELTSEVDKKSKELIQASEKIVELESTITNLEPFKLQFEEAERKQQEIEKAEKQLELKEIALKSGYITEKELESSAVKKMVDELDEQGIKLLIADRVINNKNKNTKLEVSARRNLIDDEARDYKVIMTNFLGK